MTDIETISICDVDYTDRPSEHEDVEVEARISGVIQRLGLLPANKILAGFRQCLAGFLESDLSLEAHRRLHRLKPEKKDLNPSPFDQKGRPLNQIIGLAVPQGDVK